MGDCPVCGTKNCEDLRNGLRGIYKINCPNCGVFAISDEACDLVRENGAIRGVVSCEIWRNQNPEEGKCPVIPEGAVENLLKEHPQGYSVPEQLDNYVIYLGERDSYGFQSPVLDVHLTAKTGSTNQADISFLRAMLSEDGLINDSAWAKAKLTIKGWNRYRELKEGQVSTKAVFMAMPFSDVKVQYDGEEKVIEIQPIYETFQKAAADAGFKLSNPLEDQPKAGEITERMMVEIRRSRFVVADLTGNNPGAYWEAGFAEGLGKKVFYSCEQEYFDKEKTHFDCSTRATIKWDPKNLEAAREELKARIRNTFFAETRTSDE